MAKQFAHIQLTDGPFTGLPETQRLNQLFTTVGDATGTSNMAATNNVYKVTPPAGSIYHVERINIYIEDNAKFQGSGYGEGNALVTGINVSLQDANGTVVNFTPLGIKKIGHWALLAGVDVNLTDFTTGNDWFIVRWTLSRSGREAVVDGDLGQFLQFNVQSSLAALVDHTVNAQGFKETAAG